MKRSGHSARLTAMCAPVRAWEGRHEAVGEKAFSPGGGENTSIND